ncbi:hypothetical protein DERP_003106 [Dermatophagoides pteronyssinus]|uniref:Uncharacterized protein n=1 Tax=Dermatophagoides pteronyssinus TaxID=6956 RepID=A0ABQ8JJ46_DERPT|nr:hypothetical protein DERP_003106 [Dermatophagoides pteronyssinus]
MYIPRKASNITRMNENENEMKFQNTGRQNRCRCITYVEYSEYAQKMKQYRSISIQTTTE